MNDQQIPVQELLALLGRKELEIYMLRKALTQFQNPPVPPDGPQPPEPAEPHVQDGTPATRHRPRRTASPRRRVV